MQKIKPLSIKYRDHSHWVERPFEPREFESPPVPWQEKAGRFVQTSHDCLLKTGAVMDYLSTRGLDEAAVKKFCLGYFPGENGQACMYRSRASWGLSKVVNDKTGREKVLWVPRGIVIPCFVDGKVYRVRIRRPKPDLNPNNAARYYVLPGSGMDSFSIDPGQKALVVVESELDGILVARHAGSLTGVIALGSATAKPGTGVFHHLKTALRILVALDFDEAGLKAWAWWEKTFPAARQWPVPFEKDPGDAFKKGLDLKEWVKAGLPPVLTMSVSPRHNAPDSLIPPKGLYPIQELQFFLKRLPVQITATKTKHEINFGGVGNGWIRNRISQLFFNDEDLFYYFKMYHPDDVIHGGNCEWPYRHQENTL